MLFGCSRAPKDTTGVDAAQSGSSTRPLPARGTPDFGFARCFNTWYWVDFNGLLGQGSTGNVFRCQCRSTGQLCAAKVISKSSLKVLGEAGQPIPGREDENDVAAMACVQNEVAILHCLQRGTAAPELVQFYGAFEDDADVFLVFEMCHGDSLLARLRAAVDAGHPFSERETLSVMAQLLRAISALHNNGIMHRDVKCENLLFAEAHAGVDTGLRLVDFGVSEFFQLHAKRPFHGRTGTLPYMAPEVLKGKYSKEADIFSCGVVMYFLLTGQLPFASADLTRSGQLDTAPLVSAGVSSAAIQLLLSMLQRVPQARCSAAQALSSEWVTRGQARASALAPELDVGVVQRMRQYCGYDKVKQNVLLRIAELCGDNDSELQHLRSQFRKMDINNDGCLSKDEVQRAMRQFRTGECGRRVYADKDIEQVMDMIDADKNGIITYQEFVAASLSLYQVSRGVLPTTRAVWHQRLRVVFDSLDRDRDGKISKSELMSLWPDKGEVTAALQFDHASRVQSADKDRDGHIDYKEFLEMMKEREIVTEEEPSGRIRSTARIFRNFVRLRT